MAKLLIENIDDRYLPDDISLVGLQLWIDRLVFTPDFVDTLEVTLMDDDGQIAN